MQHPFEQIPDTRDTLQFPGGDITVRQEMDGMQLCEELTGSDEDTQLAQFGSMRYWEINQWSSRPHQNTIHSSIKSLAKKWGRTYLEDIDYGPEDDGSVPGWGNRIATLGAFGMLAYAKKSLIIPCNFAPILAEDLQEMAEFDQKQIRLLADTSWSQMHEAYPRLYQTAAPVARHISKLLDIQEKPEELVLLDAATALPYLLAATSRMDGYLGMAVHDRSVDRTIERLKGTIDRDQ